MSPVNQKYISAETCVKPAGHSATFSDAVSGGAVLVISRRHKLVTAWLLAARSGSMTQLNECSLDKVRNTAAFHFQFKPSRDKLSTPLRP